MLSLPLSLPLSPSLSLPPSLSPSLPLSLSLSLSLSLPLSLHLSLSPSLDPLLPLGEAVATGVIRGGGGISSLLVLQTQRVNDHENTYPSQSILHF